jgi:hypothetical protein
VLDLLDAGVRGTVNPSAKVLGLFCSESGADSKKAASFISINAYYRQDNKVVYQKAGIYFSLQAKIKVQEKSLTGIWVAAPNTYLHLDAYVKFKPKCKSEEEKWHSRNTTSNELNYRPYENTRGLNKYIYEVQFYGGGWSPAYEIRAGY